jgi:hypothetical protein
MSSPLTSAQGPVIPTLSCPPFHSLYPKTGLMSTGLTHLPLLVDLTRVGETSHTISNFRWVPGRETEVFRDPHNTDGEVKQTPKVEGCWAYYDIWPTFDTSTPCKQAGVGLEVIKQKDAHHVCMSHMHETWHAFRMITRLRKIKEWSSPWAFWEALVQG